MKLHKSLILTLLSAGSLIMGSAQAQEKLFSAQMGNRLDKDASLEGSVYPLGTPKETFGILVHTAQSAYIQDTNPNPPPLTDLDGDGDLDYNYYKRDHALRIFSVTGTELKNFSSVIPAADDFSYSYISIHPFGNGGFVLQVSGTPKDSRKKYLNDYIFFSRVGADWVETSRFKVDRDDKASIQDGAVFEDGMPPAGVLAFFKNEGEFVIADVYTSNKEALTPVPVPDPQITSDLSDLVLKVGKPMPTYSTTTNFETAGFVAFGLPPGVRFNAATGQISGKPTVKGNYSVVIGASKRGAGAILATKNLRVK